MIIRRESMHVAYTYAYSLVVSGATVIPSVVIVTTEWNYWAEPIL